MLKLLKNKIFCCIKVLTLDARCTIFFNKKQFAVCVWVHEKEEDKMNKAKSVFAISFAAVAFGLVACGDDSSSGVSPDQESLVSSSDSEVPASSGDVVGESSSSINAESSSSIKPDTSSVVNCFETQSFKLVSAVRCDDGQYFDSKQSFALSVTKLREENPDFAKNCGEVEMLCFDGPIVDGERIGGCDYNISCPQKLESAENCEELVELCRNSKEPTDAFAMSSECYNATNLCPGFSLDVSSSSVIPASSSSVNAVSVDCQKYEFLNEEVPCDVAEGRCFKSEYRCDDGRVFADVNALFEFVLKERDENPLYAENCKVNYLCVDGFDAQTGEPAGGCFPVETCPVIAVCDYRDSAGKCISFEQHVQACRESATAGTACVVDEINQGYQSVGGCDFFCRDGKWEYLPPPTSNTEPGNSSGKEEIYWWQEPCSVDGEQRKQDFGDAVDTYECNDGKWKIINKEFPNCDAFTDC